MEELLNVIRGNADDTDNALLELVGILGTAAVDISVYRTTTGFSAAEILSRINVLLVGAKGIAGFDTDRLLLAPTNRLTALRDHLQNLAAVTRTISANLRPIGEVGVASSDPPSGTITGSNGSTINLRSLFDDLLTSTDKALETYLVLAAVTQPKGIGTFAAASRAIAQSSIAAEQVLGDLQKQAGEMTKKAAQLDGMSASVTATHSEAQRLAEEIAKVRRTAEENEQKILSAATAAEESRSKAASVDAQVVDYEDKFKAFQTLLDTREADLKKGSIELATLQDALRIKDSMASDLVDKANKMLGGATIAGLSSTFHNKAKGVDDQLAWARRGFYASIVFLLLSVLIALNLTNFWGLITGGLPPLPLVDDKTPAGALAIKTLAALGSRALVVLPALLLAGFAAHRHAALFRLREEYSHKEALAVSVQGFKEQAPGFEEPIAAAVFQELLNNPANSMDKMEAAKRENGFVQRLITPAVEKSLTQMLELRDGALSNLAGKSPT